MDKLIASSGGKRGDDPFDKIKTEANCFVTARTATIAVSFLRLLLVLPSITVLGL